MPMSSHRQGEVRWNINELPDWRRRIIVAPDAARVILEFCTWRRIRKRSQSVDSSCRQTEPTAPLSIVREKASA